MSTDRFTDLIQITDDSSTVHVEEGLDFRILHRFQLGIHFLLEELPPIDPLLLAFRLEQPVIDSSIQFADLDLILLPVVLVLKILQAFLDIENPERFFTHHHHHIIHSEVENSLPEWLQLILNWNSLTDLLQQCATYLGRLLAHYSGVHFLTHLFEV